MIHLIIRTLSLADQAHIDRDLKTVEDDVNTFVKNKDVTVRDIAVKHFESGGKVYLLAEMQYDMIRK